MTIVSIAVVKILFLFAFAFVVTVLWTPLLTHFLYRYKLGKSIRNTGSSPIFSKMHAHKAGTPTMGGVLVWGTMILMVLFFGVGSKLFPSVIPPDFSFFNSAQTLLPLGALVASAIVGLIDDIFDVKKIGPAGGGLSLKHRLVIYAGIALFAAYWFYVKLGWSLVHIPFYGNLDIGWWAFPLFIVVIVATSFSVNETDGLDGLAGGVLMAAFSSYVVIAFVLGRYDLATFSAVICGALLAFLWFNIHPARFIMGDTGSMSLGVTLGVIAILTNTIWLLPLLGFILVIESGSVILQVTSKKLRKGKKIFLSTPIHHHFEAIGWPEPKIVMRFWIIASVIAVLGLVFFLIDRAFIGL
ncbi:MAG: phospho-N-acetylmuramoyl-pentapeptide-transferase [Candidatus Kerfeldbacteria bacterium CG15_BIG_FIL_POST_REV_8_21_14_020_45_12]|uniref:Phospho-N-acetylmuramoyl-pentapeptide-transferase n=1 Tax=Candidatus Kerfeldbacteria bacterium CG15_BIG_FIL_POST_REV_8_21_14_020_45_12 TaxID=2014247 RepID=A0A2M7H2A9_9BACT|nr:MAG: phospho-N-acetylmuramoyl-pentapeptide-transferase [Candidatus Kerfeldbacteria bacterium CG15_BIG_FIL_POST_REV_8_21_14_020_45_12]PJA93721.1 MAG: phospho-N-acetylmuramoyl-pentapeptide-transferase [Candidatus Kerfeldbacteria bacterium CG_4_9_14_3_um_filter_45_8]